MADTIVVTTQNNIVEVVDGSRIDVYATGAVRTGWLEGTGTGLASGTKIYIGPSSGVPDNPQENDIWIRTA